MTSRSNEGVGQGQAVVEPWRLPQRPDQGLLVTQADLSVSPQRVGHGLDLGPDLLQEGRGNEEGLLGHGLVVVGAHELHPARIEPLAHTPLAAAVHASPVCTPSVSSVASLSQSLSVPVFAHDSVPAALGLQTKVEPEQARLPFAQTPKAEAVQSVVVNTLSTSSLALPSQSLSVPVFEQLSAADAPGRQTSELPEQLYEPLAQMPGEPDAQPVP